jgi:hypothetical protein
MKKFLFITLHILSFQCLLTNIQANDDHAKILAATLNGEILEKEKLPSMIEQSRIGALNLEPDSLVKRDAAMLIDWVLEEQKKKMIRAYGIKVSDEEVHKKIQDILKDKPSYLSKINETLVRLPKALRAAQSNPAQADRIFDEHLKEFMSYELWKAHLDEKYTEEELLKLENQSPVKEEHLQTLNAPIRKILIDRKLKTKILEIENSAENQEKTWQLWCLEQIESADVLIYNKTLKDAYNRELNELKNNLKVPTP